MLDGERQRDAIITIGLDDVIHHDPRVRERRENHRLAMMAALKSRDPDPAEFASQRTSDN